ncbi:hypothetical protein ACOSQ2_010650 [Xanthoceras sorbifolium]
MVDVSKPPGRGLRVEFSENGEASVIVLCYEKLPNFCYFCRRIRHLVRECTECDCDLLDTTALKFGAWMRAPSLERSKTWEPNFDLGNKGSKVVKDPTQQESGPESTGRAGAENLGIPNQPEAKLRGGRREDPVTIITVDIWEGASTEL